ncbi:hypothetical protein [Streptomyces sp. OR43]|uniref:hypothetical protein n=1 Tax=Streptomyces sp. or43 TaxID=2478957 RepID=UPI0011CE442D|nr:hypothetical protein [Streptomyces sp. or43]TXS40084.1 hypothetical protein EAO72_16830 [Streptomyces sp. or43]
MAGDTDRIEFRYHLKQAMKERFGPRRDWPLDLRAATAQLEQIWRFTGDDFHTFVDSVKGSLEQQPYHRGLPMDPLMRALARECGTDEYPSEIAVAWSIMLGLSVLLGGRLVEVEHALVAARDAWRADAETPQLAMAD